MFLEGFFFTPVSNKFIHTIQLHISILAYIKFSDQLKFNVSTSNVFLLLYRHFSLSIFRYGAGEKLMTDRITSLN